MDVAERALAFVEAFGFVRRVGRFPDAQVVPTALFERAEVRHDALRDL
jgi:hypothetical protein